MPGAVGFLSALFFFVFFFSLSFCIPAILNEDKRKEVPMMSCAVQV